MTGETCHQRRTGTPTSCRVIEITEGKAARRQFIRGWSLYCGSEATQIAVAISSTITTMMLGVSAADNQPAGARKSTSTTRYRLNSRFDLVTLQGLGRNSCLLNGHLREVWHTVYLLASKPNGRLCDGGIDQPHSGGTRHQIG